MADYSATLKDGSEIFIPQWSATVSFANLGKVSSALGVHNIEDIADKNYPAVIRSLMNAKDPEDASGILQWFVCTARMDGHKITDSNYDKLFSGNLPKAAEIFMHVVHATYSDFFERGAEEVAYLKQLEKEEAEKALSQSTTSTSSQS